MRSLDEEEVSLHESKHGRRGESQNRDNTVSDTMHMRCVKCCSCYTNLYPFLMILSWVHAMQVGVE